MPDIQYRMYFDNKPASREQLDRVEEITVAQEVDMAWEARLQVPICTDENGKWSGEDEDFMAEFTRVRVEIKVGNSPFVPLIDGPIVGWDNQMSSAPGSSAITLIVQDDSVYLNRDEKINPYENRLDHEIAEDLFSTVPQITKKEVDETPACPSGLPAFEMQRGTQMDLLRRLARRHDMHAYVLPGKEPGQSIGAFKKFPTRPDGKLPPLILLGSDCNIATFSVKNDAQSPSQVDSYSLSIADKVITKATSQFRNLELLGKEQSFTKEKETAKRLSPPGGDEAVCVAQSAQAQAQRDSFAFEASGSVLGNCYSGVLSPYRVVTVKGVNGRLCGDYVIKKVSHRLTRSVYSQSFGLLRNARSEGARGGLEDLAGTIF